MTKRITEKLILKGFVLLLSLPYAMGSWEFNQNRPLDASSTPQAPLEAPLKSIYVGRYRLSKDDKKLFPTEDGPTTKERKEFIRERLFTTEVSIPESPLKRYYVEDLQYKVIPSDKDGKALESTQGLRLIPITSNDPLVRIPTAPINFRQRYPKVVEKFFRSNRHLSPTARAYDQRYVRNLLNQVQQYQITGQLDPEHPVGEVGTPENPHENPVLTDTEIAEMIKNNTEPSVGTEKVEEVATLIAYGKKDKQLPIHMIVPHTTSNEWQYKTVKDLASPSAKPQTGIHHVSGFYRFDGVSKDSRRSMLSEGEPTNLRMVFVRKGKNNPNKTEEAIEATQLNLALWFMLYYENPEGYAFSDDYEFDDSYITNLEEVFEMARGWLNRSYVRKEFNALQSQRIAVQLNTLMKPVVEINAELKRVRKDRGEKLNVTKETLVNANNSVWEMRSLISMIHGEETAQEIETLHSGLWEVMNTLEEAETDADLQTALNTISEANKTQLTNLVKKLVELNGTAAVKAQQIPYYSFLQSDPTLAEYCNEGVKDQIDKGVNVPLARKWLYTIYPKADADEMFKTAENKLCYIQATRMIQEDEKEMTDELQKQLNEAPCTYPNVTILSRDLEPKLEKMTPLFTLPGTVAGVEAFTQENPVMKVDPETRPKEIRLIGNGLVYAPHTTLDIINNFTTAFLPFHKAGAPASAAVAMGFLKEHLRRTGIDSKIYVAYTSKILNELFAGEAKIKRSTLPARAWPLYEAAIADFFNTKLPKLIDGAIAAESNDNELHGHGRQLRQGPNNIARDRPAIDGKSLAEALYLGLDGENGVKKALETSVPDVTATGDAQFSFKVYKETNKAIAKIVSEANHKFSTVPANAFDAIAAGTKRVKFYYQPGINALSNMGLVKNNPNAMFVEVGTAVDESRLDRMNTEKVGEEVRDIPADSPNFDKQYIDQQIDNLELHKALVKFVESDAEQKDLDAYRQATYKNSIVGRPD